LQLTLSFAVIVLSGTHEPDASKALIAFLRTPEVAELIKTKGMEPN